MRRASIVDRVINPVELMSAVQSTAFGAISMFIGTVRDTHEGRSVSAIDYSAYAAMADTELETILAEAEDKFEVSAIVVEHRVGSLALGDVSVAIAAAHAHRAPALDATRYVIEEIKKRVPIWKLEHYADGTLEWVDPTATSGVAST